MNLKHSESFGTTAEYLISWLSKGDNKIGGRPYYNIGAVCGGVNSRPPVKRLVFVYGGPDVRTTPTHAHMKRRVLKPSSRADHYSPLGSFGHERSCVAEESFFLFMRLMVQSVGAVIPYRALSKRTLHE